MNKLVLAVAAATVLALAGLASQASAFTLIDWVVVSLEEENVGAVPVTIPCGGGTVELRGVISVHLLVRDDGSFEYRINAEDAAGTDAATGESYRLVGASSGEARAGMSLSAGLLLVGPSRAPVPVELLLRTSIRESSELPDVSLESLRVVQPCDPGTLTLSDAGIGGFYDYRLALVGTALDPASEVSVYGVAARGGAHLIGTLPVPASGSLGELLNLKCSDGAYLYAVGTSASGTEVTSNTYVSPCPF
jgi:hypothetical protein